MFAVPEPIAGCYRRRNVPSLIDARIRGPPQKKRPPLSRGPFPFNEALSPGSSQQQARHRL